MVGEDERLQKDLVLVDSEFQRQGKELQKEQSENLSLNVRGGRERKRWSEERVFPVGLIL